MQVSVRTKLFLLVVIALTLSVGPIIVLTYNNLRTSGQERDRESFANTVVLLEDSVSSRYLNLLTTEVMDVLQCKNELRQAATLARSTWEDLYTISSSRAVSMMTNWSDPLMRFSTYLEIFEKGTPLLDVPALAFLARDEGVRDFKKRLIRPLLIAENLSSEGEFVALYTQSETRKSSAPLLVYLLPVPETGHVIAAAMVLSEVVQNQDSLEKQIILGLQEKLDELTFYEGGFISLFSGDGTSLAHKGLLQQSDINRIPPAIREEVRRKGSVTYEGPLEGAPELGPVVFQLAYFKDLDWYIIAAAPQKELEANTNALIQRLIVLSVVLLIFSLLCALYLAVRISKPIRVLTHKALAIPSIDFASPDAEELILRDLPVTQNDEVGQLARAFARMGNSLAQNIRELMETTASQQRMQGELNAARDIQMGILPAPDGAPSLPNYAAAAFLEPAKEVGGDLYDFFTAPDGRQAVIIGDVSGKGVPAALFMSMTVTLVRSTLASGLSPAVAMTQINEQLSANNPGCMFVTLFIGLFDPQTGVLEFANGGHCQPLVVDASSGDVRLVEELSGPLVGALDGMDYDSCFTELKPGERCLLYTDGVTEAMNTELELFDEARIREVMAQHRSAHPDQLVQAVYKAILAYRGSAEPSDDITMLAFMRS